MARDISWDGVAFPKHVCGELGDEDALCIHCVCSACHSMPQDDFVW